MFISSLFLLKRSFKKNVLNFYNIPDKGIESLPQFSNFPRILSLHVFKYLRSTTLGCKENQKIRVCGKDSIPYLFSYLSVKSRLRGHKVVQVRYPRVDLLLLFSLQWVRDLKKSFSDVHNYLLIKKYIIRKFRHF